MYMAKKSQSEQIQWLVDWYKEQKPKTPVACLDANNYDLNEEFEEFAQANLGWSLWKSRIRDAASILSLEGRRIYIADASPSAGIPRFTMVYQ